MARQTKAARPGRPPSTPQFTEKERAFVHAIAMKYLKDDEEARDATQDALLLAFRYRDGFRGDSRFTTWLYRIAATTALMRLRKRRRSPLLVSSSVFDDRSVVEPRSPDPSPEELSASNEAVAQCERTLENMGDKYGKVFRLRFIEEYSESEIGSRLGLNVCTVKTRAHRARVYLRRQLAGRPAVAA
jgi:RNA polymerase sigma-70 factor, ECF subfamily